MDAHLHLDNEALLRVSYGIEQDSQWRDCAICRAAVEAMLARRSESGSRMENALPEWFWQRQRQSVLSVVRTTPVRPLGFRWSAIGALAAVVLAGWMAMQPAPKSGVQIAKDDERLLNDVSMAVNRVEPQAMAPMDMLWTQ